MRQIMSRGTAAKILFWFLLGISSVYYFIFLGEPGVAYTNDSLGYLEIGFERFPVYPMLFQLFLKLFGSGSYLLYATYFQGILASASVLLLLCFLRRQFYLNCPETVFTYLALLLPYGIDTLWDTPRFVYTHYIATEGLTYSLYYLFIACLLHFLLNRRFSGLCLSLVLIPLMCCTRTQLMICYPVLLLSILYVYAGKIRILLVSAVLFACSFLSITLINNGYHWYYQGDFEASSVNEYTLFANQIFVADREDASLIQDRDCARLFTEIFDKSYALGYHYDFAPDRFPGLSDQLIASHDKIKFDILYPAMREYTGSLSLGSAWKEDLMQRDMLKSMNGILRRDNLGKWLHTCLALVPEALMLSFNPVTPPQILLLCYAYALFMTAATALYVIWFLYKKRQFTPPLLALSAVYVLLLTNAAGLSISLYGLSRYTNYNLGLIYVMIYLCVRRPAAGASTPKPGA